MLQIKDLWQVLLEKPEFTLLSFCPMRLLYYSLRTLHFWYFWWPNVGGGVRFAPHQTLLCNTSWASYKFSSVQFSSFAQSCSTLCDPMNQSMPGLPVHHHLLEFTQTHIHRLGDAIQPSHPLLSPFPPAPNPSQHQSLFQWVSSSHEVAKVLEFQL